MPLKKETKPNHPSTYLIEQNVTQDQFLSGEQLVWIQSFPSVRLMLKNPTLSSYLMIAGLEAHTV